jgi:hypothetical protein
MIAISAFGAPANAGLALWLNANRGDEGDLQGKALLAGEVFGGGLG